MSVKTVKVIDPRIEPQPEPVYGVTVSPKQNQFYKIPASGLSDSYITFNNLTTLGADRAYLDTFELEITADVSFTLSDGSLIRPDHFTFDSFPFNKCCEEARININGGAFFSQPLSYLRAKERYWDEQKINDSYANVCPCHKPYLQSEACLKAHIDLREDLPEGWNPTIGALMWNAMRPEFGCAKMPTRTSVSAGGFMPTASGALSSCNNSIIPGSEMYKNAFRVTWREPIFASPFSSRIDATWGRPLYNITSMDLAFNLQDLTNMIRTTMNRITQYTVHLADVQLCYQVETIPPGFQKPGATVVPYRRIVPYITDAPSPLSTSVDNVDITLTSGVYTLNEVPTAIWVFAAPSKAALQMNPPDGQKYIARNGTEYTYNDIHGFNKLFGFMKHISISCGNTTQILNTAAVEDLYRIAKANGCQDDFTSWSRSDPLRPYYFGPDRLSTDPTPAGPLTKRPPLTSGVGSVLRLIPGTDIVLPEQDLVPGSNANNLVFQVSATFDVPACFLNYNKYSLWLLFEYVGVATITPGQCEISMNPLGDGRAMASAPVVSATQTEESEPATLEGSGWFDKVKNAFSTANKFLKKTGLASKALSYIPTYGESLSKAAKSLGYGYVRPRDVSGGAVMGMGDFV